MRHETSTAPASQRTTGAPYPASSSLFGASERLSYNSPSINLSTTGDILSPIGDHVNYCFSMEDETTSPSQFPAWLQRRLDRRGWSAADLHRESGIAPQTISKWLLGERTPRKPDLIHRLAVALSVHQDEILEQLDMRDGGADRMSLAVRRLQPLIDSVQWNEGAFRLVEGTLANLRAMQTGAFTESRANWENEE